MRWGYLLVVGGFVLGCGHTRRDSESVAPNAGSSNGSAAGEASEGGSAPAATSGGSNATAGTSTTGGSEATGGTSTTGGTGALGGAGGESGEPLDLEACSTSYTLLQGAPRTDGPASTTTDCASIADKLVLERYNDPNAKVPQGLYYELRGPRVVWGELCSQGLQTTLIHADPDPLQGMLAGGSSTDWYNEAELCQNGRRGLYRELRCDYWDGENFSGKTADDLAFLGSLLWWQTEAHMTGSVLLGYSVRIGNATDWVEMCTVQTTYGDFGLCDEISLYSTTHLLKFGGTAILGEPKLVRTLKGECH